MLDRTITLHRPALALAAVLLLAGCATDGNDGSGALGGPTGRPGQTAEAGARDLLIVSRVLADGEFVEVEIRHRSHFQKVEQVALIGPDGAWHRARDLRRRKTAAGGGRPRGHFGIAGGSSGPIFTGIGVTIPLGTLGSLFSAPAHRTRALVRVPDPAGYRADPERWQVAVVMGSGVGATTTIKRPAPTPR
jgi:hypothetical protein